MVSYFIDGVFSSVFPLMYMPEGPTWWYKNMCRKYHKKQVIKDVIEYKLAVF